MYASKYFVSSVFGVVLGGKVSYNLCYVWLRFSYVYAFVDSDYVKIKIQTIHLVRMQNFPKN